MRDAGLDLRGEAGLTLGEIGGFLAVGVVFVFGAALLADRLVAREVRGIDLQREIAAELIEDGGADSRFLHEGRENLVKPRRKKMSA